MGADFSMPPCCWAASIPIPGRQVVKALVGETPSGVSTLAASACAWCCAAAAMAWAACCCAAATAFCWACCCCC